MEFQRHLFPTHDDELVIDNFAGGGGASTGIARAIGRSVDVAINHDPEALRMHELNHPETRHYCENILDVDPLHVCAGRSVGVMATRGRARALITRTGNGFGLVPTALRWADNWSLGSHE